MTLVQWNDRYLIGIDQLDNHHRQLFFLLNYSYEKYISGSSKEEVFYIIDELIDYATYHIAMEEHVMDALNYPKATPHKQEHAQFFKKVKELSLAGQQSDKHLLLEILAFIHDWFSHHFMGTDMQFGSYVAKVSPRQDASDVDQYMHA